MVIVNSGRNPIDPEPCDECDLGIMYILGYDGIRRCKNCIQELSRRMGWDEQDRAYREAWYAAKAKESKTEKPVEEEEVLIPERVSFSAMEQTGLFDVESPEPEKPLGNYPRQGTTKEKILVFIARQRDDGATDDEMSILLKQPVTTISANRNQLMNANWLKDSGRRRKIRSGNMGTVWVLTSQAKDELIKS